MSADCPSRLCFYADVLLDALKAVQATWQDTDPERRAKIKTIIDDAISKVEGPKPDA